MYGIKIEEAKPPATAAEEEDDIEAAIEKEVAAMNAKNTTSGSGGGESDSNQIFTLMKMNVDCLLFVKTKAPIEPVEFVRRICLDAREINRQDQRKCRYVNRFTPAALMGKATEAGIVEVAKLALSPFFDLSGKSAAAQSVNTEAGEPSEDTSDVGKAEVEADSNTDAQATTNAVQPRDYKPLTVSSIARFLPCLSSSGSFSGKPVYLTPCNNSMPSGQPFGIITS